MTTYRLRSRKWLVVFCCIASLIFIACGGGGSQKSVTIGKQYTTRVKCYGGSTVEMLDKGHEMATNNDDVAFTKMMRSGQLQDVPNGTTVTIEEVKMFGKIKVRIQGQVNSVWIFDDWLSK